MEDIMEDNRGDEYSYEIKIPEERVAVLIGSAGKTKKEIEELTQSTLEVSKEGDVIISGTDAVGLYTVREIVRAIGRGFNPKVAAYLLKPDYALEVIDLSVVTGKNKNTMERLKGRVIGTNGKAREEIERLSETNISVYGKTVSIIGEISHVAIAREALAMLIQGVMHKTAYHYLERKKKEMLFGDKV